MRIHSVGGLTLACATNVLGLRPAEEGVPGEIADIVLSIRPAPEPAAGEVLFRWPGRYGLTLGTLGTDWLMTSARGGAFLVSPDGRRVEALHDTPEPSPEFFDILVRRVLPRVALLFGTVAIHGAALGKHGGAVLMLGGSGAGKSTLAAALAWQHGWDLLSDDITILRRDGATSVAPAATGVCVWPDSREALALPPERCRLLPAYGTKAWFDTGPDQPRPALPLRALLSLERSAETAASELTPLSPAESLVLSIHQLIQFNPGAGKDELGPLIERLRQAIEGVPAYRLTYPADYAALPRVAGVIEGLIA